MRRRDESFAQGWGQIATSLSVETAGGFQKLNCVSTKGAFRLIQSIPSKDNYLDVKDKNKKLKNN